jgi:hypothetical protein
MPDLDLKVHGAWAAILVQAMVGLTLLLAWRSRGSGANAEILEARYRGGCAFLGTKARTRATLELP